VTIGANKRAALFFKMIEVSNEKPPGRRETEETTRPKPVARRQLRYAVRRLDAVGCDEAHIASAPALCCNGELDFSRLQDYLAFLVFRTPIGSRRFNNTRHDDLYDLKMIGRDLNQSHNIAAQAHQDVASQLEVIQIRNVSIFLFTAL
jgi:hypothetical protein